MLGCDDLSKEANQQVTQEPEEPNKQSLLVGEFYVANEPTTVWTFYKNGIFTTEQPSGNLSGTYKWADENNLAVTFDGRGEMAGMQILPLAKIDTKGIYFPDDPANEPFLVRK